MVANSDLMLFFASPRPVGDKETLTRPQSLLLASVKDFPEKIVVDRSSGGDFLSMEGSASPQQVAFDSNSRLSQDPLNGAAE